MNSVTLFLCNLYLVTYGGLAMPNGNFQSKNPEFLKNIKDQFNSVPVLKDLRCMDSDICRNLISNCNREIQAKIRKVDMTEIVFSKIDELVSTLWDEVAEFCRNNQRESLFGTLERHRRNIPHSPTSIKTSNPVQSLNGKQPANKLQWPSVQNVVKGTHTNTQNNNKKGVILTIEASPDQPHQIKPKEKPAVSEPDNEILPPGNKQHESNSDAESRQTGPKISNGDISGSQGSKISIPDKVQTGLAVAGVAIAAIGTGANLGFEACRTKGGNCSSGTKQGTNINTTSTENQTIVETGNNGVLQHISNTYNYNIQMPNSGMSNMPSFITYTLILFLLLK